MLPNIARMCHKGTLFFRILRFDFDHYAVYELTFLVKGNQSGYRYRIRGASFERHGSDNTGRYEFLVLMTSFPLIMKHPLII